MRILPGHKRYIRALAYSPTDPFLLASAGDDGAVRLWNPATGESRGTLPPRPPGGGIFTLAFAPGGDLLVSGSRTGFLEAWDVPAQRQVNFLPYQEGPLIATVFATDGQTVIAAPEVRGVTPRSSPPGDRGRLLFWDVRERRAETMPWGGAIHALAVAPGGGALAIADEYRSAELWELGSRRQQTVLRFRHTVNSLAFSPEGGTRLLAVATGCVIECWDVSALRRRSVCRGHRRTVRSVAFSPDGRSLLSGGADRTVRLWDAVSGSQRAAWDWKLGPVRAVALAPDGMTAAACGDKADLVTWDLDEM
jgi:WD40 repeat protein